MESTILDCIPESSVEDTEEERTNSPGSPLKSKSNLSHISSEGNLEDENEPSEFSTSSAEAYHKILLLAGLEVVKRFAMRTVNPNIELSEENNHQRMNLLNEINSWLQHELQIVMQHFMSLDFEWITNEYIEMEKCSESTDNFCQKKRHANSLGLRLIKKMHLMKTWNPLLHEADLSEEHSSIPVIVWPVSQLQKSVKNWERSVVTINTLFDEAFAENKNHQLVQKVISLGKELFISMMDAAKMKQESLSSIQASLKEMKQKQAQDKRELRKIQEEMEKIKNELSVVQNEASDLSNQLDEIMRENNDLRKTIEEISDAIVKENIRLTPVEIEPPHAGSYRKMSRQTSRRFAQFESDPAAKSPEVVLLKEKVEQQKAILNELRQNLDDIERNLRIRKTIKVLSGVAKVKDKFKNLLHKAHHPTSPPDETEDVSSSGALITDIQENVNSYEITLKNAFMAIQDTNIRSEIQQQILESQKMTDLENWAAKKEQVSAAKMDLAKLLSCYQSVWILYSRLRADFIEETTRLKKKKIPIKTVAIQPCDELIIQPHHDKLILKEERDSVPEPIWTIQVKKIKKVSMPDSEKFLPEKPPQTSQDLPENWKEDLDYAQEAYSSGKISKTTYMGVVVHLLKLATIIQQKMSLLEDSYVTNRLKSTLAERMRNVLQAISKKGFELHKLMKDAEFSEYAREITHLKPSEKQLTLEQEKQKLHFGWKKIFGHIGSDVKTELLTCHRMKSVTEDLSEAGPAFSFRSPMQMQVPQYKTIEPDTGDFTLSQVKEREEDKVDTGDFTVSEVEERREEFSPQAVDVTQQYLQETVMDDITPLVHAEIDFSMRQVLYGICVEVRPKYEKTLPHHEYLPSTTPPPASITKRKTTELTEAEQKIVENRIHRMIDFHTEALGKGKTVPLATEQLNSMKELLLKKKPMKHRLKEISLPAVASPESGALSKHKNKAVLQVNTWIKHQSKLDDSFQNQTCSIRQVCKEREEEMKVAYFKLTASTESFIEAETKEKLPKLARPTPEVYDGKEKLPEIVAPSPLEHVQQAFDKKEKLPELVAPSLLEHIQQAYDGREKLPELVAPSPLETEQQTFDGKEKLPELVAPSPLETGQLTLDGKEKLPEFVAPSPLETEQQTFDGKEKLPELVAPLPFETGQLTLDGKEKLPELVAPSPLETEQQTFDGKEKLLQLVTPSPLETDQQTFDGKEKLLQLVTPSPHETDQQTFDGKEKLPQLVTPSPLETEQQTLDTEEKLPELVTHLSQIETDDKSWKVKGDYLWTECKPSSFFLQTPHILELDVSQSRRKAGRILKLMTENQLQKVTTEQNCQHIWNKFLS